MKKVDFDIVKSSKPSTDIRAAARVMRKNRHLLNSPNIFAMWVGARASEPYIMLGVESGRSAELNDAIPDTIDGIPIYYVEGKATLH